MPQVVEIPGQGTAEFPDELSHDEISSVIQKQFFPQPSTEGSMPNVAALKAGKIVMQGATSEQAAEQYQAPLISSETIQAIPSPLKIGANLSEVLFPGNTMAKVARGIDAGTADVASSLTSPMNLSLAAAGGPVIGTLGKLGTVLLSAGFEAQALKHAPEQWKEFKAAYDSGDYENAIRIGSGMVASLGLPAAAVAIHGAAAKPTLTESLFPETKPTEIPNAEVPIQKTSETIPTERVVEEKPTQEVQAAPEAQPITEEAGASPQTTSPATSTIEVPSEAITPKIEEGQVATANDFTPALKTSDGTVIKGEQGQTHQNIYDAQADPAALHASGPEHGFVDKDGNFRTRQEVSAALGEAEPIQSERLAELQNEKAKGTGQTEEGQEGSAATSENLQPTQADAVPQVDEQQGAAEPTGISHERLTQTYGEDAVIVNKGKGPQEWQRIGQADTRDPYSVLSESKKQGIATPKDVALLRAEHQRLVNSARNAYGKPEYNELAQRAADMANAIKEVAHGPASDVFRALQEVDIPKYDSPADFDAIVRERMNREATPKEQETFGKIADELKNGDKEVVAKATEVQRKLRQYRPKENVPFDEASKFVREQIKKLTEPCVL